MDETQAIARIRQGDWTGLETLVERYQVRAVHAAYLVLQDRQLAEDVVQNAFVRVPDKIRQYDEHRPFGPWFLRSVVNAALDAARREKRYTPLDDPATGQENGWLDRLEQKQPGPQELAETQELRQAVRAALQTLTPEQRAAIVLRYFLEMDEAELSDTLRRPPSTVKWWLHAAKRKLERILRPFTQSDAEEERQE